MAEAIPTPGAWQPRNAWTPFATPGRHGRPGGRPGVRLSLRDGFALAAIVAAAGAKAELASVVETSFGLALPETGRASIAGERALIWSGPGQWLAVAPDRGGLTGLAPALKGLAAVTDQSDALALVRLSGPDARDALARGVALDLHPRAFSAGSAAMTSVAHLNAQIWQRDEAPTYDLAFARSLAGSAWAWLAAAADPFGYEVEA